MIYAAPLQRSHAPRARIVAAARCGSVVTGSRCHSKRSRAGGRAGIVSPWRGLPARCSKNSAVRAPESSTITIGKLSNLAVPHTADCGTRRPARSGEIRAGLSHGGGARRPG